MASYTVNQAAVTRARAAIRGRQYVLDVIAAPGQKPRVFDAAKGATSIAGHYR